jgi:hypothetical protein
MYSAPPRGGERRRGSRRDTSNALVERRRVAQFDCFAVVPVTVGESQGKFVLLVYCRHVLKTASGSDLLLSSDLATCQGIVHTGVISTDQLNILSRCTELIEPFSTGMHGDQAFGGGKMAAITLQQQLRV